jgi:HD-GYP domain-containing protein (c-di-GMP phosphodiesterase class II)
VARRSRSPSGWTERLPGRAGRRRAAARAGILSVADVHDALVSPRVYRAARSHEEAITLLRKQSGTAFDPRCVAALERILGRDLPAVLVA